MQTNWPRTNGVHGLKDQGLSLPHPQVYMVLKQLATLVDIHCFDEKFVLQASSVFVTVAHFYNGLIFVDRTKKITVFTEI